MGKESRNRLPRRRANDLRLFSRPVEIANKTGVGAEFFWHMNCGKKFHG
jgi:hypothetical protein